MSFPRSVARVGALALVSSVIAACGGDSTSPLVFDDSQFESVAASIALEIENSAMTLTADGAMDETDPTMPMFSLGSPTSQRVLGGATYDLARIRPKLQISGEECGDWSQEIPVDTDDDQVPDNFTITFRLPECRTEFEGGVMEMTGIFRISDPTPGTPGFALRFGLDNLRITMDDGEDRMTFTQDGSETVNASATGLSQALDWAQAFSFEGFAAGSMSLDWTNTFTPAQGSSIVVNQPLPNGNFSPNGTIRYREGKRLAALTITTVEPLEYDAGCAADYEAGMVMSPFTGGQVHIAYSGEQGNGYVRVTYTNCNEATVSFINPALL